LALLSLRVTEPWVPRPCVFCKGGYDAADTGGGLQSAFVVSALRKDREERGTHSVCDARPEQRLGHPSDVSIVTVLNYSALTARTL
jgi:hypothetical protein